MYGINARPALADIVAGRAIFDDSMPIWFGRFGDDVWPFDDAKSPLFKGETTSSIVWRDFIHGRGATLKHSNSKHKSKYELCLTPEIVADLKVAAVIYGYFPNLIKDARFKNSEIDPKTVKGRIDDLARFFSIVILDCEEKFGYSISRLAQIPLQLVKENIAKYPGRSTHLKRALKLISDPIVQKNLSFPLQWNLFDITKSAIAWAPVAEVEGIPSLSDVQFIFLLNYCKKSISKFKRIAKIRIQDSECEALPFDEVDYLDTFCTALDAYYTKRLTPYGVVSFSQKYGVSAGEIAHLIRDAHISALLLILFFTGMRSSETMFVLQDSLIWKDGYWFVNSKVVKGRSKDAPISEGWLMVDIARDAYDVLSYITRHTGNPYLFSSPFVGHSKSDAGYRHGALNTKLSRWIRKIDKEGLFATWTFSIHQCRETLVSQLAKQDVGMPFLSMQLKHFHSQFKNMPNAVTAGYGNYRSQLMTSILNRIAGAREDALMDIFDENAKFAGGGGTAHKARIDAFFSGLGLFGKQREKYIKDMAQRGVRLMPTSIGNCTRNFLVSPSDVRPPPCYGDYQCDPECDSHVITERGGLALRARKAHALGEAAREPTADFKVIWLGLAQTLEKHIDKLDGEEFDV